MNTSEILRNTQRLLYELVDRLSSQKAVADALALTDGHVSRLLSGSRKVFLEDLFKILGFLEVSPRLVMETVCEEPTTPVELLRAFRKGNGLSEPAFLAKVEAHLPSPDQPRMPGPPSRNRPLLLRLEEDRFCDAAGVKLQLEELILGWLPAEPLSPALLGDIATALSIWASVQRSQAQHDDASRAYGLAFAFLDKTEDPWVSGLLYQKVAALMMDLKRAQRGLELLKEAHLLFTRAKDPAFLAKVHVDLGVFNAALGRYEEAVDWHTIGLESLPATASTYRFNANFDLAWLHLRRRQPDVALRYLKVAEELVPKGSFLVAYLRWLEGDIRFELRERQIAAQAYEDARQRFLDSGRLGDSLLAGLDRAQVLLTLGEQEELRMLILALAQVATGGRCTRQARSLFQELSLACFRGKVSFDFLSAVRKELESAHAQDWRAEP